MSESQKNAEHTVDIEHSGHKVGEAVQIDALDFDVEVTHPNCDAECDCHSTDFVDVEDTEAVEIAVPDLGSLTLQDGDIIVVRLPDEYLTDEVRDMLNQFIMAHCDTHGIKASGLVMPTSASISIVRAPEPALADSERVAIDWKEGME